MTAISTYAVHLTQGLQGSGCRVHVAPSDGFVTLTLQRGRAHGADGPSQADTTAMLRIAIGLRDHVLWVHATEGRVLSDWPIGAGEEGWIASSNPSEYVVSGYQTRRPL